MRQLYSEEQLYHFDGKLYKIKCNNSENQKIILVWKRDEKVYQKERKRSNKQLDRLMEESYQK